jgi:hypothetical protein
LQDEHCSSGQNGRLVILALLAHGQAQAAQFLWNAFLLILGGIALLFALIATRLSKRSWIAAFMTSGMAVQALVFWRLRVLERLRDAYPSMTPHSWTGEMLEGGGVGLLVEVPSLLVLPSGIVAWVWLFSLLLLSWRVLFARTGGASMSLVEVGAGQQQDEADEARDG